MLTKICVAIWGNLETMGINQWVQSKAVDVILDQRSAGHAAHNRAWKRGNAHHRADVAHRRAYILENTFHQTQFLDCTK